jgi:hypothetical protein
VSDKAFPRDGDDVDARLRALVEQPVPPMSTADARDLRNRVVARMHALEAQRISRRASWARWRRVGWASAAAACVLLAGAAAIRRMERVSPPQRGAQVDTVAGAVEITADGVQRHFVGPAVFGPDDELRTDANGSAVASLPTGARVAVGPSSRVRFEGRTGDGRVHDRIELAAGRVAIAVPKLKDGDEVRVHTEGATVVVHGTKFSVEHVGAGGESAETRVAVTEGRVVVYSDHGEDILTAGQEWASGTPRASELDASGAPASPEASDASDSTLARENALLADAIRLARDHQSETALSRLDAFVDEYPHSPLAETALVERLHVLDTMHATARLRVEARKYLLQFPQGSARVEVKRLLAAHGGGQ